MSAENCTHNCSTCGENCASRTEPQDLIAPLAEGASVKHVYAVVSGKGGVASPWSPLCWAYRPSCAATTPPFWMPTLPAPPSPSPLASMVMPRAATAAFCPLFPSPACR